MVSDDNDADHDGDDYDYWCEHGDNILFMNDDIRCDDIKDDKLDSHLCQAQIDLK